MNRTPKQLRKLYIQGVLSFETYIMILKHRKEYVRRTFRNKEQFSLDVLSDSECQNNFCFTKQELRRLYHALQIPMSCRLPNGIKFSGFEGLLIMLQRFCYSNRLCELESMFNRDLTVLSRIANCLTRYIFVKYRHLIYSLRSHQCLTTDCLRRFADLINASGCAYPNIVGFIDGTARCICRPKYNQRLQYSGYKKTHVLKYQSVMFPNGIIGRLDGPVNGKRHDSAILHITGLLQELETKFVKQDGTWFAFYGDPGYVNQKFIKTGFRNLIHTPLTQRQREFNSDMSSLRVSVEYGFGKIIQLFAFLDFKKNQKLYMQNIKEQYVVAAILANCHTCLRRSQVSTEFISFICKCNNTNLVA
jgi:hypothetical protein